jgi:thymidylate synthase
MERPYLDLVDAVLRRGEKRIDRTLIGTRSIFSPGTMTFDLADGFPVLTTKKVNFNAVKEELLWFLRGETDANKLASVGVKIWDANGSRETLDTLGFNERRAGDLGPVYGFQWRHFGARYVDAQTEYEHQGVDQISKLVHGLKTNPTSRRHILSAWNPVDMPLMVLPPCHIFSQFYVGNDRTLHCHLYQRSGDIGLGVPFNIASYSLLTCMLAHVCDLTPGSFHHTIGDAHIYENHIDALKTQLERTPRPFPTLKLSRDVKCIFDFTSADITLERYDPHPHIHMSMAV